MYNKIINHLSTYHRRRRSPGADLGRKPPHLLTQPKQTRGGGDETWTSRPCSISHVNLRSFDRCCFLDATLLLRRRVVGGKEGLSLRICRGQDEERLEANLIEQINISPHHIHGFDQVPISICLKNINFTHAKLVLFLS